MSERERVNYDHPDAFEHDLLLEHLKQLRSGLTTEIPCYDYGVHTRSPHCQITEPSPVLNLEGILLLHDGSRRDHYDLSVFVDTPLDVCLSRRMRRDVQTRGRSRESVIRQFEGMVKPMYRRVIEPTRAFADLIVSGEEEVTGLVRRLIDRMNLEKQVTPHEQQGQNF